MPISAQTGDVTWHHGHAAKRKALRICSSFPPIATSTAAISQWPLNVDTNQADWVLTLAPFGPLTPAARADKLFGRQKGAEALTGPSHLAMARLVTAARLGVRNVTSVATAPEDEAVRRFRDCKCRSPKLGSSWDKPGEPFWRRCSIGRSRPSSKGSALLSKVR